MIQRIQTVYLSLALLSLALMFAFKIAIFKDEANEWFFSVYGLQPSNSVADGLIWFPPFILNVVLIILLLVIITMFKNRKMQLMLGRLSYLLILGYFVLLYFWTDGIADVLIPGGKVAYSVGVYFPVAALAFVFLANRAIKKDEELVKSLDRLR
jgi:glycopeptide antibiotics resistance protein